MSTQKRTVHVSDIKAFKACRRKFAYSSPLFYGLESNTPYAPFFTGRIIHTALEDFYSGKMSLTEATQQAIFVEKMRAEAAGTDWNRFAHVFNEQVDLIEGMMFNYELWINGKRHGNNVFNDQNLEFLELESSFKVPLFTPSGRVSPKYFFGGRFDGIVRRKDDGSLWLWETKTTRSIQELINGLELDEQATSYVYAAQLLLNEKVSGVLYNIIRKKVPSAPTVLKNGTLSQNKSTEIPFETYLYYIRKQHPDWQKDAIMNVYGEYLTYLSESNSFFDRVGIRRTEYEIESMGRHLYTMAVEMNSPKTQMYPTPSWSTCNFCAFKQVCVKETAGFDVTTELQTFFRSRGDRALRPWQSVGFNFIPITAQTYLIHYKNEDITQGQAINLSDALNVCIAYIKEKEVEKWSGPSEKDFLDAFLPFLQESADYASVYVEE